MILICVDSGSSGNCYLVLDNNGHYLMLDCGEKVPWESIQTGHGFSPKLVDAAIITHAHKDHLGHVRDLLNKGIKVFSNDETAEFASLTSGERVIGLKEKTLAVMWDSGWKVLPWYVPHTDGDGGRCPCFAYFIQSPSGHRMVYITDFMHSPMTFKLFNVQTILVACNHDDDIEEYENSSKYKHILSGHSSLSVVKQLLRDNQTESLRNVILCHLSRENATPSEMLEQVQETVGDSVNVCIATKGLHIDLRG